MPAVLDPIDVQNLLAAIYRRRRVWHAAPNGQTTNDGLTAATPKPLDDFVVYDNAGYTALLGALLTASPYPLRVGDLLLLQAGNYSPDDKNVYLPYGLDIFGPDAANKAEIFGYSAYQSATNTIPMLGGTGLLTLAGSNRVKNLRIRGCSASPDWRSYTDTGDQIGLFCGHYPIRYSPSAYSKANGTATVSSTTPDQAVISFAGSTSTNFVTGSLVQYSSGSIVRRRLLVLSVANGSNPATVTIQGGVGDALANGDTGITLATDATTQTNNIIEDCEILNCAATQAASVILEGAPSSDTDNCPIGADRPSIFDRCTIQGYGVLIGSDHGNSYTTFRDCFLTVASGLDAYPGKSKPICPPIAFDPIMGSMDITLINCHIRVNGTASIDGTTAQSATAQVFGANLPNLAGADAGFGMHVTMLGGSIRVTGATNNYLANFPAGYSGVATIDLYDVDVPPDLTSVLQPGSTVNRIARDPYTAGLAAASWATPIIDGYTPAQALQFIAAILCGKISTAQTDAETFIGLDGLTPRVTVAADTNGNRSAVTLTP